MDAQKIRGYRALTPEELELVNKVKAIAVQVGELVDFAAKVYVPMNLPDSSTPIMMPLDPRWVAIARTHLQEGFMALNRAIMKPTTF